MSSARRRKAKPTAPRKQKPKPVRKRVTRVRKPEKEITEIPPERSFILAVRLLGAFGVPENNVNTLMSLRLRRRFSAVLLEKTPSVLGMLRQAKDHVTWGEVKTGDIAALLKERGELIGGSRLTDKFAKESFGEQSLEGLASALTRGRLELKMLWQRGIKPVFRLHPPSGGFAYSIKRPFGSRGELGYRGAAMSSLVARMT